MVNILDFKIGRDDIPEISALSESSPAFPPPG